MPQPSTKQNHGATHPAGCNNGWSTETRGPHASNAQGRSYHVSDGSATSQADLEVESVVFWDVQILGK